MAKQPLPEPPQRRPGIGTGPAVVALLTLTACGAQGAAPRVNIAHLKAPLVAVVSPILPARESP